MKTAIIKWGYAHQGTIEWPNGTLTKFSQRTPEEIGVEIAHSSHSVDRLLIGAESFCDAGHGSVADRIATALFVTTGKLVPIEIA